MTESTSYTEQEDERTGALRIYKGERLVAGAGLGSGEGWAWWSRVETSGRSVKAIDRDDAYAMARQSARK